MRGIGALILQYDFNPGSDMIRQIFNKLQAAKHIEFELFRQLTVYI